MSLLDMLANKAEELNESEAKSESDLKRERLQAAKNLLKNNGDVSKQGRRSSVSEDKKQKKTAGPPPTPSRENRKTISAGSEGAFPGIAMHTEREGPGGISKKSSPKVSKRGSGEKSMEKSQHNEEDYEDRELPPLPPASSPSMKRKKGKKNKNPSPPQDEDEDESSSDNTNTSEQEEQDRLEQERLAEELRKKEEEKRERKAKKKAERKERKRKEKEQQEKEAAERAKLDKAELERIEREEFEREQKEREERERAERERIEREDKEEEERERKRKEAAGAKKADEDDLDLIKGEIWGGFFENSNIIDMAMSRASAAFYQELKGGAATLLEERALPPLPPNDGAPALPSRDPSPSANPTSPRAGGGRGASPGGGRGSQTVRPSVSERAIGKINPSQWEKQAKEAPAAPKSSPIPGVSRGSVMEKAKFLHETSTPVAKTKSEVQVGKLTNSGVIANLQKTLQPGGPKPMPPRQPPPPGSGSGGPVAGGAKPPPPVGAKPLTASAPASTTPTPTTPPPTGPASAPGSPAPPAPPGGSVIMDITPLEYQTADSGKTIVVAGSLPSLLNKLVSDKDDDEDFDRDLFVNSFLIVHPLLLKSSELLQNLKDIYTLYSNKPIIKTSKSSLPPHVRALQVVNTWANTFVENFVVEEDGAVRKAFIKWVDELKLQRDTEKKDKKKKKKWKLIDLEPLIATVEVVKAEAHRMREENKANKSYMKKKKAYKEKKKMARNNAPLPEKPIPTPEQVRTSIVKEYSAKELAQQLTYADYTLFKRIRNSELFNQNWTKHKEQSPNLVAMIKWFNEISMWTMSQIVCVPDEKERTAALRKFIEIGKEMKTLNNYNGVMLILSALNNTAVRRLKSNWEALPKSVRATFVTLQDILNPDENFGNLRSAMKTAEAPVIPFMGLYLTQMTYIDENEDKKDGLVNFNKMLLFAKVLLELKRFRGADYPFKPIPSVQNYLLKKIDFPDLSAGKSKRLPKGYGKLKYWDEKENYQQSLLVKPRDENA